MLIVLRIGKLQETVKHLTKIIAENVKYIHNIVIDVEYVIRSIPGVSSLIYDDLGIKKCCCKKYFQN